MATAPSSRGPGTAAGGGALRFRVDVRPGAAVGARCRLAAGRGSGARSHAGQWVSFVVQARDAYDNPLRGGSSSTPLVPLRGGGGAGGAGGGRGGRWQRALPRHVCELPRRAGSMCL